MYIIFSRYIVEFRQRDSPWQGLALGLGRLGKVSEWSLKVTNTFRGLKTLTFAYSLRAYMVPRFTLCSQENLVRK